MYVKPPAQRAKNRLGNGFSRGDAALKKGEYVTVSGVKITVMESGDFGDVVKVEKVS
jgi:hypothetical protein